MLGSSGALKMDNFLQKRLLIILLVLWVYQRNNAVGGFSAKDIIPRLARQEVSSFYSCQAIVRNITAQMRKNQPVPNVPRRNITDTDVTFELYTRQNYKTPYPVKSTDNGASLKKSPFDSNKLIFLWMHGYGEYYKDNAAKIVPALLPSYDLNVFFVNYDTYAFYEMNYSFYVTSTLLGKIIANFLKLLIECGANVKQMYLAGFSMGGQSIGLAGKFFYPDKIARILSIEPVGLCFNYLPPDQRIAITDADYVEIMHCALGNVSMPPNLVGNSTFYLNGGLVQPYCLISQPTFGDVSLCSHFYCREMFFKGLYNFNMSMGLQCDSYKQYQQGRCSCTDQAVMGYYTRSTDLGLFFVDLDPNYPARNNEYCSRPKYWF